MDKEPEIGESLWDMHNIPSAEFKDYEGRTWRIHMQSWQTLPVGGGSKLITEMIESQTGITYTYYNKMLVVLEYDETDTVKLVYSYDDRRIGVLTARLVE